MDDHTMISSRQKTLEDPSACDMSHFKKRYWKA
jgi:hypothetical protein